MPKLKPPGNVPKKPASNQTLMDSDMEQVKIKRVQRNKKKVTTQEKILAGLGVGGAIMGGASSVAPKAQAQNIVSTQSDEQSTATSKIKSILNKIFGATVAVPEAKASYTDTTGSGDNTIVVSAPSSGEVDNTQLDDSGYPVDTTTTTATSATAPSTYNGTVISWNGNTGVGSDGNTYTFDPSTGDVTEVTPAQTTTPAAPGDTPNPNGATTGFGQGSTWNSVVGAVSDTPGVTVSADGQTITIPGGQTYSYTDFMNGLPMPTIPQEGATQNLFVPGTGYVSQTFENGVWVDTPQQGDTRTIDGGVTQTYTNGQWVNNASTTNTPETPVVTTDFPGDDADQPIALVPAQSSTTLNTTPTTNTVSITSTPINATVASTGQPVTVYQGSDGNYYISSSPTSYFYSAGQLQLPGANTSSSSNAVSSATVNPDSAFGTGTTSTVSSPATPSSSVNGAGGGDLTTASTTFTVSGLVNGQTLNLTTAQGSGDMPQPTAQDGSGNDISADISTDFSQVTFGTPGTYQAVYNFHDASGNLLGSYSVNVVIADAVTAQAASTTTYNQNTVTSGNMDDIHDQLVSMIQNGQVPTIDGGSVTAYMLGWGSSGGTQTVLGQTYNFDGSNWQLQTAANNIPNPTTDPVPTVPSSPAPISTTYTYSEAQISAILNSADSSQVMNLLNRPYSSTLMDGTAMTNLSYYAQANHSVLPTTLQTGSLLAYMCGYNGGGAATPYTTALGYVSDGNGNLVLPQASNNPSPVSSPSSPTGSSSPSSSASPSSGSTTSTTTTTGGGIVSANNGSVGILVPQQNYTVGQAYSYQLSVWNLDANGNATTPAADSYTWTLGANSVLPPGMSFNASTGVLSGTPTAAGGYKLAVTATDAKTGATVTTNTPVNIIVTAPAASSTTDTSGPATNFSITNLTTSLPSYPNTPAYLQPSVTLTNQNGAPTFGVGDSWVINVEHVPADSPVYAIGGPVGNANNSYVYLGEAVGGYLTYTGPTLTASEAGNWDVWIVVGTPVSETVAGQPGANLTQNQFDALQKVAELKFTVQTASVSNNLSQTSYPTLAALTASPAFIQGLTWSGGVPGNSGTQGNAQYASYSTAQWLAQVFGGKVVMIPGADEYANFQPDGDLVTVTVPGQSNDYQYAILFPSGAVINAGSLAMDYWQGGSAMVQQQISITVSVPYYVNVDASGAPTGQPVAVPGAAQAWEASGLGGSTGSGTTTGGATGGTGTTTSGSGSTGSTGTTTGTTTGTGTGAATVTQGVITGASYNSSSGILTINGSGFGSGLSAGDIVLLGTPAGQQLATQPTSVSGSQITVLDAGLPSGSYTVSVMLGNSSGNVTNTYSFVVPAAASTGTTTGTTTGAATGTSTGTTTTTTTAPASIYVPSVAVTEGPDQAGTGENQGNSGELGVAYSYPLTLSSTAVSLTTGQSSTVTATVTNPDGTTGTQISATSADNTVATVTANSTTGIITITAVAPGSTAITVHPSGMGTNTADDQTISVTVTASAAASGSNNSGNSAGTVTAGSLGGVGGDDIVIGSTPFFTTISLPVAYVGQSYSGTIQAASNYAMTYSIVGGSLPAGLTMASNGVISGIPTAAGNYNIAVQAVTSQGQSAVGSYALTVNAQGANSGAVTYYNTQVQPAVAGATAWPAGLRMPAGYPASGGSLSQSGVIDLSARYADVNGTIYDKNTGIPFSTPQQLFQATGITSFNNVIFDMNWTPGNAAPAGLTSVAQTYTVKKGDTLYGISQKVYGTGSNWRKILSANPGSLSVPGDTKTLKVGAVLNIPQV
jgi:nucleoid-associated protein YgaU